MAQGCSVIPSLYQIIVDIVCFFSREPEKFETIKFEFVQEVYECRDSFMIIIV